MNKILLTIFLLTFYFYGQAQEKTEVLLLGTYHFGGNTTDSVKVTNDNILGKKKQKEIDIVLNKLEKFKPDEIYIENEPIQQVFWDSIFTEYKNGTDIKIKNELFQIATKLAVRLNLNHGATCVDWHIKPEKTFAEKEYIKLFDAMNNYYLQNNIPDDEPQSKYEKEIIQKVKDFTKSMSDLELIDVYRKLNSKSYLNEMFYTNITSFLDIDEYNMNVFWSQNNMIRNVNIYQNIIQDILKTKPKRVLVLIGVGHIKALKNYLEVHPTIKIVDTEKYLE
ncbi:DUF5694 domain-containing protein [Labilibaculum euxinus]|uniref:TraB/GumN family protein n=1 Tax=Labilibaculum euxinus TaxID=2686357 RepID=A0A7M4DAD5_9BACT|nr:DUF5694 domain-containing protein [Labilibaculum euxinus]MUP39614.1 hypothetical protein [Labilibaculum euxinus]MVB08819.1 hypothetical protein [Labilibaculum euxinus]